MLKFPVVGELVHPDPTLCVTGAANKLEVGQITDTLGHVLSFPQNFDITTHKQTAS